MESGVIDLSRVHDARFNLLNLLFRDKLIKLRFYLVVSLTEYVERMGDLGEKRESLCWTQI